jgi:hypothetical protein
MADLEQINTRWRALTDQGLVIQLSDGQLRLLDLAQWERVETRVADVLPEGSPPPGAHLVAHTVGTTLLWKSAAGRYCAWRTTTTVHEYRPDGPPPAPELGQLPRYAR